MVGHAKCLLHHHSCSNMFKKPNKVNISVYGMYNTLHATNIIQEIDYSQ